MKQNINRLRLLEISNNSGILKDIKGIKASYAIAKNLKEIKSEVELISGMEYTSDKLKEYQQKYSELLSKEAKKDENGNLIQAGKGNVVIENIEVFKEKVKTLGEEYKDEIDLKTAKDKELNAFLKEDFEFDFYQFPESELVGDISVEQMMLIFEMIKE